jgi:hypothetical protein
VDNTVKHGINSHAITRENISPIDTWFTSNTGTTSCKARYHEWQTDALAAAAANAQIEGDTVSATAITATTRLGNYTQILRKAFAITDTEDLVDKAGRDSEISYQTQLKLKELARDIEYALVINASTASGATGTARQLKGVLGWIATNTSSASATGLDITPALFNNQLQVIWAAGGKPQHALVGGYVKQTIDAWTTNTRYIMADAEKLVSAVSVFQSSFGTIQLHLHQQINTTSAGSVVILGDMSLWQKAWLRKPKTEKMARTAPATLINIECELTLESRQEKGSGWIKANKSS